ncbi:MAG: hypothetical protein U0930_24275 [Pirellulales bacterium]
MSAVPNTSHLNFLGIVPKADSGLYASAETSSSANLPAEQLQSPALDSQAAIAPKTDEQPVVRFQMSAKRRGSKKLHRVAEVRASQGVSERTMCRRLNVDVKQLRAIEDPTYDLSLSQLAVIRDALEVPFADLLVENDTLSRPVQERAQMLKIMKTAVSIKECKLPPRAARLAQMLCEQMIALMPELAEVGGWPEFGSRRGSDSVARILASEIDTSNIKSE